MTDSSPSRGWCFTSFVVDTTPVLDDGVSYIVWQLEMCPATKREHFQGWFRCKRAQRFKRAQSLLGLGDGVHLDRQRGSDDQCEAYCTKEVSRVGGPWRLGSRTVQGQRTDLQELVAHIVDNPGFTSHDYATERAYDYFRYKRNIADLRSALVATRTYAPIAMYIHGPSGTGKSAFPAKVHGERAIYRKDPDERWWDGYEGQVVCVIDDIRSDSAITVGNILRLLDPYPLKLPVKCSFAECRFEVVYVTSNYAPENVWGAEWCNIKRRFMFVRDTQKEPFF